VRRAYVEGMEADESVPLALERREAAPGTRHRDDAVPGMRWRERKAGEATVIDITGMISECEASRGAGATGGR
jgi:hypothetical protein